VNCRFVVALRTKPVRLRIEFDRDRGRADTLRTGGERPAWTGSAGKWLKSRAQDRRVRARRKSRTSRPGHWWPGGSTLTKTSFGGVYAHYRSAPEGCQAKETRGIILLTIRRMPHPGRSPAFRVAERTENPRTPATPQSR